MGIAYNPKIVTNGLMLCLDAGNTKSYPTYLPNSYSNYFDGSGDFLSMPANAAFDFGAGNFTIEAWVYISGNSTADPANLRRAQIFDVSATNTDGIIFWIGGNATTTGTGLAIYNGSLTVSVTATIPQQQWNHIAVSKSGTSVYFFLNGTQVGTTQTTSGNWGSATLIPKIGGRSTSSYTFYLNGYISNLRVLKGTALYTANFTVPSSPLTNIANTSLLTCQSVTFIDNSTNSFTVTANGNTSVQSVNPFISLADLSGNGNNGTLVNGPTYSGANGGSIVFDGNNDYINTVTATSLGINSASTSFSISVWFNTTAISEYYLFDNYNGDADISLRIDGGKFEVYMTATGGIAVQFGSGYNNGGWHNFVLTWNGSNTINAYADAINIGSNTTTITGSFESNAAFRIGSRPLFANYFPGNIAQVQIYNRALSAAEVQQNFNASRGRYGI